MRDIVFHLADESMEKGFKAFFRRTDWHFAMECARFDIDPDNGSDIYRISGHNQDLNPLRNDPGIQHHAHENLATHLYTHKRAVIILDEYFGGTPGAEVLREEISANMRHSGWDDDRFEVVVIQPMLEAWLWANNLNVAKAFGFSDFRSLQEPLIERGLWQAGQPKPEEGKYKEAKVVALKLGGKKLLGNSPFGKLFEQISSRAFDACQESGFQRMRARLQDWFPMNGGGQ